MEKRELQNRTKQFALRVLKLIEILPHTAAGRAISNQLVRAATSVGANYRSARHARSRAEFAAKLGVAVEEADESLYWAGAGPRRQPAPRKQAIAFAKGSRRINGHPCKWS
jgi:four helix bundle protein